MTSGSIAVPVAVRAATPLAAPGATAPAAAPIAVRVGVLAVQGDFREHIRAVESLGAKASPVRRPEELDAVDGLIIPGGESTTMDKLTRSFGLAGPLKERIAAGLPVYGSCAGMIMLADRLADPSTDRNGRPQQTLGGLDMVVRRNAFGRQRESFETDLEFAGLAGDSGGTNAGTAAGTAAGNSAGQPAPVHAVFIRAPWVEEVGESIQVLARVPRNEPDLRPEPGGLDPTGRIVAVRSGNLIATSFHPEVTGERRIHELFIRIIRGEA